MVAAAAAAAVVAKNVRLFIVPSLEVFRNLVNADDDSELPIGFVTRGPSFGCSEPWHKQNSTISKSLPPIAWPNEIYRLGPKLAPNGHADGR
jgi:hypothetical protein